MSRESQATVLFVVFLVIFGVTFVVTALGITGTLPVAERFLWPLFVALILEVVSAVVYLFRSRMGLVALQVAMDFGDKVPQVAPTVCRCTIFPRGAEHKCKTLSLNVVRQPGALVVTLPEAAASAESVQLEVCADGKTWRSDPFSPTMYPTHMALQP